MSVRSAVRLRRPVALVAAALATGAVILPATASAASTSPSTPSTYHRAGVHYAIQKQVCGNAGGFHCDSVRRLDVAKGTDGAKAYTAPPGAHGLAGGYTPSDLAKAYGINPAAATTATVATVLWADDPNALADLNAFDEHYGLPDETSATFQKVNENGDSTPANLPITDESSAGEESLDIQAIRGMCNHCKIILVEANAKTYTDPSDPTQSYVGPSSDNDLAAAENTAVSMGATVVSNSWGGSESSDTPGTTLLNAFNHRGIAITVSTGDDGWYNWDADNSATANYPSTDPHVISVGGTSLNVNANDTRTSETVWDGNGFEGENISDSYLPGAGGGGCSSLYSAQPWQSHTTYFPTQCKGHRLAADVSADADPATGFDVYDTYFPQDPQYSGWGTIGGTSLSSPLVAGMIALAGGSHGVSYPAASIYANAAANTATRYDVTTGGNGFCGGDTTQSCAAVTYENTNPPVSNPNVFFKTPVDCSFPTTGGSARPTARSRECNAGPGYDGPTGVGTPNGLALFAAYRPYASLAVSSVRTQASFAASVTSPITVGIATSTWNFGDGHGTTTSGGSIKHIYGKGGSYVVTVKVTDSNAQTSYTRSQRIYVGYTPSISVHGNTTVTHGKSTTYNETGSQSRNTGDHIAKVSWSWGDGHSSTGTYAGHAWSKKGRYTLKVTVTDTAGYSTSATRAITVK